MAANPERSLEPNLARSLERARDQLLCYRTRVHDTVDLMKRPAEPTVVGDQAILLRPITPDDADALLEFHRNLSDRTVFLRYFYPHRVLNPEEVAHLTQVDGRDRCAFVAELNQRLVAVGRYEREPASARAEVAFVVDDAFQHHGLGTALLQRLTEAARSAGITTFTADVLTDNAKMLAVFHQSGFVTHSTIDCGTVHLDMTIDSASAGQAGTVQMSFVPPSEGA
jgi:RimJ/RimL family protein N-acetyltransferase